MRTYLIYPACAILLAACCIFHPRPKEPITNAWLFVDSAPGKAVGFSTTSLAVDASENLYVAGSLFGFTNFCGQRQTGSVNFHGVILKFHPDRTCEWFNQFKVRNLSGTDDRCFLSSVIEDGAGDLLVGGGFSGSLSYKDTLRFAASPRFRGFVAKITKAGDLRWAKEFEANSLGNIQNILSLPNGNFTVMGATLTDGAGLNDIYIATFDINGTQIWQKKVGTPLFDNADALLLSKHQSFYSLTIGGRRPTDQNIVQINEWDFAGNLLWSFVQPTGYVYPNGFLAIDNQDHLWFSTSFTTERVPFTFGTDTLRSSKKEDCYVARFENRKPVFSSILVGDDNDYVTGLYNEVNGQMAITLNHGKNLTAFGHEYTTPMTYGATRVLFNAREPEKSTAVTYGLSFPSPGFPRKSRIRDRIVQNGNEYMIGDISGTLQVGKDTLTTPSTWGGFVITNRRK